MPDNRSDSPDRDQSGDFDRGNATRAPTVDLAATLLRLRGSHKLLHELIGFYVADYPALLEKLKKGIEERSTKEAKTAAHKLHGLAATFDGQAAAALAVSVETLVSNQQFAEAAMTLPALESSLSDVCEALRS